MRINCLESRPVRVITHQPGVTWLGLVRQEFIKEQLEDPTWNELAEYLKGRMLPRRKIARAMLDQLEIIDGLLHYVRTSVDGSSFIR